MFASCLPDVLKRVSHCIIESDPRVFKLFKRSFPQATVHANVDPNDLSWLQEMPAIDLQCPLGSLPALFRHHWQDFPRHQGYLKADPERVEYWRQRLEGLGTGLKVGISWQGGVAKTGKYQRSLSLSQFLPVLSRQETHFISLQYTDCYEEIEALYKEHGIRVHHWQEAIDDYDETAALVSALDQVISVCTAVIHLGGALGKPVWILAPRNPAWRYMAEGEQMPWYPSARILRQTVQGQWDDVIARVNTLLDEEYPYEN
jgi:ADP-heptose:LPS heptosyltransferase